MIPHARDPERFKPATAEQKRAARQRFGVPLKARVVLFFGTPRRHKGLLAVGAAVAALPAELQPVFLVAGAFPAGDPALEQELRTLVPATRLQLLGNQPVEQLGLTVLVSEVAPLREMVERGWVVAVEPERLTEQLARWMGDLEGLAEQGAQALVRFQKGWCWPLWRSNSAVVFKWPWSSPEALG